MDILTQSIIINGALFATVAMTGICFSLPTEDKNGKQINSYSRTYGWGLIFISVALTIVQIVVNFNDSKARDKEIADAIATEKRAVIAYWDSALKVTANRYAETTDDLRRSDSIRFEILGDAVGKHGYKLDSASRTLMTAFGDSVFSIQPYTHICEADPIKIISSGKYQYSFQVNVCNANAPSTDVDIKMLLAARINDSIVFISDGFLLSGDNLGQNSSYITTGKFFTNFDPQKTYWIFRISYKTFDKRRSFNHEEFFEFEDGQAYRVSQKVTRDRLITRIEKDRARQRKNNFKFKPPPN